MMDDLRERLLAVIHEHIGPPEDAMDPHSWRCHNPDRYPGYCECAADLADAVIAALGLESEYQFRTTDDYQLLTECRYVTPWERIEEDG